jgi:hypothetical protein
MEVWSVTRVHGRSHATRFLLKIEPIQTAAMRRKTSRVSQPGGRAATRQSGRTIRLIKGAYVEPPEIAVQAEVLRINKEARDRSLQVALVVPVIASLIGLLNAFRMTGLPDPTRPALKA